MRASFRRLSSILLLPMACAEPAPSPAVASSPVPPAKPAGPELRDSRERHFAELRQLTFGGENAEAYWSFRGDELIFQSTRPPYACDQIFRMRADQPGPPLLVSTGKGRTTCSYFFPGDARILFSSTHHVSEACPPAPDRSQGYVWPLDEYDVWTARADGSDLVRLTETPGYDAETTVCPRDGSLVFTSVRDGDLELYRADRDGKNVRRLTQSPGYDGGAFFSPDCSKIVWRASRPRPGRELDDYRGLLEKRLVRPTRLELWVMDPDGTNARQITYLGVASFGPSFYPTGNRIIFASNHPDPRGREFDLWAVDVDGTSLERITFTQGFDGFPLFSPDGTRLAFSSNRNQKKDGDTNVFVASFVASPEEVQASAADRMQTDIAWLADDARQGRGIGTNGIAQAADYIERRFREIGAEPAGAPGSFRQAFDVTVGVKVGQKTALALDDKAVAPEGFVATGFSGTGSADGPIVAAGYGITAPELGVDDYKGVRAKDRIVVVRRFTPESAAFAKGDGERRFGDLRFKAWNAREHGARGLIVVDVPRKGSGLAPPSEAPLPKLAVDPGAAVGIPVVVVTRAVGEPLLAGAHRARLDVELLQERAPAHNVVARVTAGGAKLPGVVVVGAHYDHVGLGGANSLAHGSTEVHNGADDNASGTAALFEVARALHARRGELRRDVWLVAFSGEETGVLGSSAFTRTPPPGLSTSDVVAMLNMDMVGRLRENRLSVLAAESSPAWAEIVRPICETRRVECAIGGEGFGPSDHSPFYAAKIPVLHFFSGVHADYHKPSDDTPRINASKYAMFFRAPLETGQTRTKARSSAACRSRPW